MQTFAGQSVIGDEARALQEQASFTSRLETGRVSLEVMLAKRLMLNAVLKRPLSRVRLLARETCTAPQRAWTWGDFYSEGNMTEATTFRLAEPRA